MPGSLQLFLLVGMVACASTPKSASQQTVCSSGTSFVAVTNHWDRAIDVYLGGRAVGTVTPGSRAEFPSQGASVSFRVEGGTAGRVPRSATSLPR